MSDAVVVLREYDQDNDAAFLYSTWRNALYFDLYPAPEETEEQKKIGEEFYPEQSRRIKSVINNGAQITIACLKDDPDQIIGYSVLSGDHLEFVYVKKGYRKQGIAKLLLADGFRSVTPQTTSLGRMILKKGETHAHETNEAQRDSFTPSESH